MKEVTTAIPSIRSREQGPNTSKEADKAESDQIIQDVAEDKTCNDRKNKADACNNCRFGEENFKHVRASCADGTQDPDFLFLVSDGNGNEIEQEQHGEDRHYNANP